MVDQVTPVKKGNASWKPHQALSLKNTAPGMRYRWANKDDLNLERKLAEGWDFADSGEAFHSRPKTVEAGRGTASSRTEYRDLVLMKTPEENARARADYYAQRTSEQTEGLKGRLESRLRSGGAARATGEIVIS